ncbi:MAG: hypothetical protein IAE79_27215 [Anaerolinea sp.]|nr:hypothetical protein [Anaerolinea sp.]
MEGNELIERYVHEVGQHLPRRMSDDIKLELSSLIQDAVEERTAAAGSEATAKVVAEVLREFGKPEDMAASYLPEQYLIGPALFPIYKLVISIVLGIIGASLLLTMGFTLFGHEPAELGGRLWNIISGFWTAALANLGFITLVFAVIEAVARQKKDVPVEAAAAREDWDPYKLPPATDPDRIKRGEYLVGVIFTILVIILFNVYPHWIGIITFTGGSSDPVVFPLLAPEFGVHIPWLTMLWTAEVVLKLVVLGQGRWQRSTRWLELGLGLLGMYVGYRIVTGGPIATMEWLTMLARFGIWIGLIVGGFETVGRLFKLVWGRPFVTTETIKSRLA